MVKTTGRAKFCEIIFSKPKMIFPCPFVKSAFVGLIEAEIPFVSDWIFRSVTIAPKF